MPSQHYRSLTAALAIAAGSLVLLAASSVDSSTQAAQNPACLHGNDESPSERARRVEGVAFTRAVNTAQARAIRDPCGFVLFSDQIGLIYVGRPLQ
jgi:hypothetical protein